MQVELSGLVFELQFRFRGTEVYFREFQTERKDSLERIQVDESCLEDAAQFCAKDASDTFLEVVAFRRCFADILPRYRRCLFHGAAMLFGGKACIFTAPSGTGKSTQLMLWKKMYPEKVSVINGDKPILEFRQEGSIIVHPSPWRGKENWGGRISVPLAHVIYLAQAKENRIRRMETREAILPLFHQIFNKNADRDSLLRVVGCLERIIESVPVWYLENNGSAESARFCHDTLFGRKTDDSYPSGSIL